MKLYNKLIRVFSIGAIILFAGANCGSIFPNYNPEPPREAFTFLQKEIVYQVCIDSEAMMKDSKKNNTSATTEDVKKTTKAYTTHDATPDIDCRSMSSRVRASGVIVDHFDSPKTNKPSTLILTAGHFCREPEERIPEEFGENILPYVISKKVYWRYTAYDYLGKKYAVDDPIAQTGQTDMCLLESRYIDHTPIPIAEKPPEYGDKILNIGTPYALFFPPYITLDEGYYLGAAKDNGPIIMSDLVIGPGSSGSMVIQKQGLTWKLVGMIHSVILIYDPPVGIRGEVAEPLISLGASLEQIKDFLFYVEEEYIMSE